MQGNRSKYINSLENRVRGALGATRTFSSKPGSRKNNKYIFHYEMSNIFLDARFNLSTSEAKRFLKWVSSISKSNTNYKLISSATDFASISGLPDNPKIAPLSRELSWVSLRIQAQESILLEHLTSKSVIENNILNGHYSIALDKLIEHDQSLGESIWSIQLRIALESKVGGMEAQKKYSMKVRRERSIGVLPYVCYQTSSRNEERISFQGYRSQIVESLSAMEETLKRLDPYYKFILLDELPNSKNLLAEILVVEQSHHIIDIYETTTKILLHLLRTRKSDVLGILNDVSFSEILMTSDIRLYRAYKQQAHNIDGPLRDKALPTFIAKGKYPIGLKRYRSLLRNDNHTDIFTHIYGALAVVGSSNNTSTLKTIDTLSNRIVLALFSSNNENNYVPELQKYLVNFSGLPECNQAKTLSALFIREGNDRDFHLDQLGFNTQLCGLENSWPIDTGPLERELKILESNPKDTTNNVAIVFSTIACTLNSLANNNIELALDYLDKALSLNDALAYCPALTTLKVSILSQSKKSAQLIDYVSDLAANHSVALYCVNPKDIFANFETKDFSSSDSRLNICIAAYSIWFENEDDKLATVIRVNVRKLFANSNNSLPSELLESKNHELDSKTLFFLRNICIPNFLEQLPAFNGTKSILQERIKICSLLRTLDTDHLEQYDSEISSLNEHIILDEGTQLIHSQRIHVDDNAFKRWAARDIKETYARYIELREVDDIDISDITSMLSEKLNPESPIFEQFIPKTEADYLLMDIVRKSSNEFLENPKFGLDYHLSKRVRHQSFIGLIRGPVETAKLVTTKSSSSGEYSINDHWISKLCDNQNIDTTELKIAFTDFSSGFDSLLFDAKDKKFRLRTKRTSTGLIDLPINLQTMNVIQYLSNAITDFDDFLDMLIGTFWGLTSFSLSQVREYILTDLNHSIAEQFDTLKETIKTVEPINSSELNNLNIAIGNSSTNVQTSLQTAAGWFKKVNIDEQSPSPYTLKQILDTSVGIAKSMNMQIQPKLNLSVNNPNAPFGLQSLIPMNDLVFMIFDNATSHSNLTNPEISISIELDENNLLLYIKIATGMKNPLGHNSIKKLVEIRDRIDRQDFVGYTAKEGNSGLLKLAASLSSDRIDSLYFGEDKLKKIFQVDVCFGLQNTHLGLDVV